ncbi:hypothetical protein ACH5RR_031261 [Cinchona calisaya]|uniref:DEAD-box RNA helicase Q domain-containing protein n=1 Tax=Cinchona calisaya TaxID=153742 RepID=A0ABD2YHQ6_9GENT
MALCLAATHLHSNSWTFSAKFGESCILFNVNSTKSLVFNCSRNLTKCSLAILKPLKTKASVASSSETAVADAGGKGFSTLRQLCEGHVPEHVINRMEEIGYVLPTDVQRQALPVLFSGRDCVLHAQVLERLLHTYCGYFQLLKLKG